MKEGNLRVWHIPQVPGKPFYVPVHSIEEAVKFIDVLASYDAFQYRENVKPDYTNVSGLEVFEDGEWIEWGDDSGCQIDDYGFDDDGDILCKVCRVYI